MASHARTPARHATDREMEQPAHEPRVGVERVIRDREPERRRDEDGHGAHAGRVRDRRQRSRDVENRREPPRPDQKRQQSNYRAQMLQHREPANSPAVEVESHRVQARAERRPSRCRDA